MTTDKLNEAVERLEALAKASENETDEELRGDVAALRLILQALRIQGEREAVLREVGAGLLGAYRALVLHADDDGFDMAAAHPASWASKMEAALTSTGESHD